MNSSCDVPENEPLPKSPELHSDMALAVTPVSEGADWGPGVLRCAASLSSNRKSGNGKEKILAKERGALWPPRGGSAGSRRPELPNTPAPKMQRRHEKHRKRSVGPSRRSTGQGVLVGTPTWPLGPPSVNGKCRPKFVRTSRGAPREGGGHSTDPSVGTCV